MSIQMQDFSSLIGFTLPRQLEFGCGSRRKLVDHLLTVKAEAALILTSEFGLEEANRQASLAGQNGIRMEVDASLPAEPSTGDFIHVCRKYDVSGMDVIVGMGGGSVLDIAKLMAALGDHPQDLDSYVGKGLVENRPRGLVCLPTTAGAGSEASPNAILMDHAISNKKAVISPYLLPDLVIIDPELAFSLPPAVTAATAFDALCHCIEAYANVNAHPAIDPFALQGIRLISANIVQAVENGADGSARGALAMGSLLGGMCLGPVNTAAVHALSYPLGSVYHLPHGLANTLLLSHVLRFNLPSMPERYARVAMAMGCLEQGTTMEIAEAGIEHLESLAQACSLELGLRNHGIKKEAIPGLAESAVKVTRLLQNNPRPVTHEDAVSIYNNAF